MMMSFCRCCWLLLLTLVTGTVLAAADTRLVRETEALSPEQERAALHVPEGFEVQPFASEPMINKPINLAFDARGRLWVSSTVEYPYAADKRRWSDAQGSHVEASRDAIKILEDTDGDGRADKATDFADGLNIPTGVLPWHKPEHRAGCIAWSIPNIWYFGDSDGDDKADVREVLFGPLGYEKDTHGMCSSFRLGLDGWVYATHGFNNTSRIKARDGSSLELHSGNVFRFRPDGSRVEIWSRGQVNPFGLCFDRHHNLYSADCHSAPVYQLLRGAHYPSFGKPHDGLGFGPAMCQHTHGSTGICGIVYLDGGVWGPEWDDHLFVGNVVTSRINHDHVSFTGATPKANERPDFLTSDDPWFRPVDLQLGPDNALYIADFYNKIIGHYEVPLDHPGRDKERGRIWRVVKQDAAVDRAAINLETRKTPALLTELDSPNLGRRHAAVTVLADRCAELEVDEVRKLLAEGCRTPLQHACGSWVAHRLWLAKRRDISFLDNNEDDFVDVHLLLREAEKPVEKWRLAITYTMACLRPPNRQPVPRTQLAAARALTACNQEQRGMAALTLLVEMGLTPREDAVLRHALLLAARELLADPEAFAEAAKNFAAELTEVPDEETVRAALIAARVSFVDIAHTLPTATSAEWLMRDMAKTEGAATPATLSHVARHGSLEVVQDLVAFARTRSGAAWKTQTDQLTAITTGLQERGLGATAEVMAWAQELTQMLLAKAGSEAAPSWQAVPQPAPAPAWILVARPCADGAEAEVLQSMKGGGEEEKRTGVLRSKAFVIPDRLELWINGHRGFPGTTAHNKNLVRLVDAGSNAVLATAFPPRNDRCERFEWDLVQHAGRQGRLEIVDGDDGRAYAWLGVTRIDPPLVDVRAFGREEARTAALQSLAALLQHTAPAALREKLTPYLPARPAPPPLPVSPEQRRQLDELIAGRSAAFAKATPDAAKGQQIFAAHCAACHRVAGQGGLIGPQLDGIGTRGVERLCEDILDPNRNVDAHFHVHTLKLKDGLTMSGFFKTEVGQMIILADAAGKEHRVPKPEVVVDQVIPMSLMPPVFGQTIPERDLFDLLAWLLGK